MSIIKDLNNNSYIGLFEKNNIRFIGKMSIYKNSKDEEIEVIKDIVILKNEKVIYNRKHICLPFNTAGLTSFVDYVDALVAYIVKRELQGTESDGFKDFNNIFVYFNNKKLIEAFFLNKKTIELDIFYKNYLRDREEEEEAARLKDIKDSLDPLIKEVLEYENKTSQKVIIETDYKKAVLIKNPKNLSHDFLLKSYRKNKFSIAPFNQLDFKIIKNNNCNNSYLIESKKTMYKDIINYIS